MAHIRAMQEASEKGKLQINVTSTVGGRPIADARISISYTGVPENTLERVETDSSGQTEVLELDAPPEEWDTYEEERRLFYVGMTRAREELDIVTFRKVGLTSAFSREIFPPKRQSVPEAPKPAPVRKTGQEQIAVQSKAYLPGVKLLHKAFGPGTLVSRSGDIAVIEFDSGESKKVALSVALRAKQLRLVP